MSDYFTCKICFDPYNKGAQCPITLNCGHSFCLQCVGQLGANKRAIICGICRKNTYSDYKQLGKNITLIELLEQHNLLGTEEESANAPEANENEWHGTYTFLGGSDIQGFYDQLDDIETFASSTRDGHILQEAASLGDSLRAVECQLNHCAEYFFQLQGQLSQLHEELLEAPQSSQSLYRPPPDYLDDDAVPRRPAHPQIATLARMMASLDLVDSVEGDEEAQPAATDNIINGGLPEQPAAAAEGNANNNKVQPTAADNFGIGGFNLGNDEPNTNPNDYFGNRGFRFGNDEPNTNPIDNFANGGLNVGNDESNTNPTNGWGQQQRNGQNGLSQQQHNGQNGQRNEHNGQGQRQQQYNGQYGRRQQQPNGQYGRGQQQYIGQYGRGQQQPNGQYGHGQNSWGPDGLFWPQWGQSYGPNLNNWQREHSPLQPLTNRNRKCNAQSGFTNRGSWQSANANSVNNFAFGYGAGPSSGNRFHSRRRQQLPLSQLGSLVQNQQQNAQTWGNDHGWGDAGPS